jgi:hypothetical protein
MAIPVSYEQVTYNSADGAQIGLTAADKVSFHGAVPVVQATVLSTITVSTTITVLTAAVNTILDLLKAKGLMATS